MHFYERIKELREDSNKTQAEIAELINVRQSYYSKQERNEKPFQINQIVTLCNYYGVSADYVLGLPKGLKWPR
nr:MAG TPA: helix-turn-helix domain protein [Inoviridae sp.]